MPRLTAHDYAHHRASIKTELDRGGRAFHALTYGERLALVEFYIPRAVLSEQQAKAHRKRVSRQHPSLPHRAGRAYARLQVVIAGTATPRVPVPARDRLKKAAVPARRGGNVYLLGEINPDLTPQMLARILVEAAFGQQMRQQRALSLAELDAQYPRRSVDGNQEDEAA